MIAPADCSVPTKVLSIDHTFFCFFFLHIFNFIIDSCNSGSLFRKGIEMKVFYFFTMVCIKTICLGNNLLMHIRKYRIPSAKASSITECPGEF